MVSAKASWGYPEDWIESWRPELQITAEFIRAHDVFAAELDGALVGVASVETNDQSGEIDNVWVAPEFQGRGIGRQLVLYCLEAARRDHANKVIVVSDPHALGFYQHLGGILIDTKAAPLPGLPNRTLPVLCFELNPHQ